MLLPTYSGKFVDYQNFTTDMVDIEDIAHSLSMQCRFNGHSHTWMSVAQHCVIVSRICKPEHALIGLLHDAFEAYGSDVITPFKQLLPDYQYYENKILPVIFKKFGIFIDDLPEDVKIADKVCLATEIRDCSNFPEHYKHEFKPLPQCIVAIRNPKTAKKFFLERFNEIYIPVHERTERNNAGSIPGGTNVRKKGRPRKNKTPA